MSNWQWTKRDEILFTGVVYLRSTGDVKHFYCGLDKTACGLKVEEFLPADDAITTCPECRNTPGFFETKPGSIFEIVDRLGKGEIKPVEYE